MTSTHTPPCLDDAAEQFERRRFQQELQRRIDELQDADRHEQLMQVREWKRQALRRANYDPWGSRKLYEAARVVRDMR